jgi:hypothetical protein
MTKTAHKALVREIIKQEVHAMFFSTVIPDVPWSYTKHQKRKCMMPGCGSAFEPKRWYSRFCSTECGRAHYRLTLVNWRAQTRKQR